MRWPSANEIICRTCKGETVRPVSRLTEAERAAYVQRPTCDPSYVWCGACLGTGVRPRFWLQAKKEPRPPHEAETGATRLQESIAKREATAPWNPCQGTRQKGERDAAFD